MEQERYYDPETLEKLQAIELQMLKDFDALCEKYGIDYFGCGGTALGLLRYKGFIPWDDDVDVGMLREDYDRFLQVAEKEYDGKYGLLNFETNHNYPMMNSRWVKNGTTFLEYSFKDIDANFGIFIDVYCFDNCPDDPKAFKKQAFWAWFWAKLLTVRSVPAPVVYQRGWKKTLVLAACRTLCGIMKALHISREFLYRKADGWRRRYKDEPTRRVAYMFDPTLYTSVLRRSDVVPTKKVLFQGTPIRFGHSVKAYCRRRYGADYMTPPPRDRQHNHLPYKLDLGEDT